MTTDYTKEIKDNTDSIAQGVNSIKSSVDDLKTEAGKLTQHIDDDGVNVKGMTELTNKLDALNRIASWESDIKNGLQARAASGGTTDIGQKLSTITAHTESISTGIKEIVDFIGRVEQKINGWPGQTQQQKPSPSNGATGGTETIHDTVKQILTEIKKIVTAVRGGTFKTGDEDLNNKLYEIQKLKSERELSYEERQRFYDKGITPYGNSKKDQKRYQEELRKEDREREKRQKESSSKSGADYFVASTIGAGANGFDNFMTSQTPGTEILGKGVGEASKLLGSLGPWGMAAGSLLQVGKALFDIGTERERMPSEYARKIGGGITAKQNFGSQLESFFSKEKTNPYNVRELGFSFPEAASALTEYSEAIGRSSEHTSFADMQSAMMMKRMGFGSEVLNEFDTFGKSIEETDKYFAQLYGEVSKKGLSFKNVSKAVNDNLKMAQSHTFANGLRGLERMAEKSVQLKFNMQQVATFADKVSDLEGAISTAANLSVLGGQYAQFSNPMELLYEGLNDTEALGDRMIKMFSGKARWDNEKGEMTMDPLQRQFLIEAAKGAGLNPDEMLNMAFNEGRLRHITNQIGTGTDKNTAEYIKNIAQLDKQGRAYVSLDGEKYFLDERKTKGDEKALTSDQYEALARESEKKSVADEANLGSIWKETNSIADKLNNFFIYYRERVGMWVYGLFQKIVGRQENARENVVKWAKDNGKDEESALQFYEKYKDKVTWKSISSRVGSEKGGSLFGFDDKYFSEHMDDMINRFDGEIKDTEGKSPGGFLGRIKGPSHWKHGVRGIFRGQNWEAEGGETLINKQSSARYENVLSKIQNGTFNPYSYANNLVKNDMNKMFQPLRVAGSQNQAATHNNGQVGNNNVSGTIKVDIPQTITINIAGGGKIGDYDIRPIIMKYVDEIMKEAQMRKSFSGFDKENFYNQSGMIFGA